jgi:hypothetical protein
LSCRNPNQTLIPLLAFVIRFRLLIIRITDCYSTSQSSTLLALLSIPNSCISLYFSMSCVLFVACISLIIGGRRFVFTHMELLWCDPSCRRTCASCACSSWPMRAACPGSGGSTAPSLASSARWPTTPTMRSAPRGCAPADRALSWDFVFWCHVSDMHRSRSSC